MKRFSSIGTLVVLIAILGGCSGSPGSAILPTSASQSTTTSPAKNAPLTTDWLGMTKAGRKHTDDGVGGVGNLLSGTLAFLLGDAQPVIGNMNVASINLGIDAVNVVYMGKTINLATYATPYVVNVMANGGEPSSIGIGQFYQGMYDHIQLVFDTGTSNVTDANGNAHPIQFQVGQASQSTAGAGQNTVTSGGGSSVTVTVAGKFVHNGVSPSAILGDFNAMESLSQNSSGQIVSNPTLYAVGVNNAAEIQGQVVNSSGQPVQNAVVVALDSRGRVANTTNADANGNFDLHAINAGTYRLVIFNNYTTASGQTINASGADAWMGASFQGPSVTAPAGSVTQVGTLND